MRKIREVLGLKYEAGLSARADVGRRSPSPSRVRSRPRHRQKHALLQKRMDGEEIIGVGVGTWPLTFIRP